MVAPPTHHQQTLGLSAGLYNQVENKSQMIMSGDSSLAACGHLLCTEQILKCNSESVAASRLDNFWASLQDRNWSCPTLLPGAGSKLSFFFLWLFVHFNYSELTLVSRLFCPVFSWGPTLPVPRRPWRSTLLQKTVWQACPGSYQHPLSLSLCWPESVPSLHSPTTPNSACMHAILISLCLVSKGLGIHSKIHSAAIHKLKNGPSLHLH